MIGLPFDTYILSFWYFDFTLGYYGLSDGLSAVSSFWYAKRGSKFGIKFGGDLLFWIVSYACFEGELSYVGNYPL